MKWNGILPERGHLLRIKLIIIDVDHYSKKDPEQSS